MVLELRIRVNICIKVKKRCEKGVNTCKNVKTRVKTFNMVGRGYLICGYLICGYLDIWICYILYVLFGYLDI